MLRFLEKLFGSGDTNYKELLSRGSVILDVRTAAEYSSGHIAGSVNIPLQSLQGSLHLLQKDQAIIACCASGIRSATAKSILKSAGFSEVYNGGSWTDLKTKI